jgi:uncharacterized membrane protein
VNEMGSQMTGIVMVVLAMLGLMALVLFAWAAWRGWRWTRRGKTRGALIVTNVLVAINAVTLALMMPYALDMARNPVGGVWMFVTLPPLVGYVLGTSLGLLRTRRGTEE